MLSMHRGISTFRIASLMPDEDTVNTLFSIDIFSSENKRIIFINLSSLILTFLYPPCKLVTLIFKLYYYFYMYTHM